MQVKPGIQRVRGLLRLAEKSAFGKDKQKYRERACVNECVSERMTRDASG